MSSEFNPNDSTFSSTSAGEESQNKFIFHCLATDSSFLRHAFCGRRLEKINSDLAGDEASHRPASIPMPGFLALALRRRERAGAH